MKLNLFRILSIVLIFFLILTIWYLFEMNEVSRRNANLLLEEKKSLEAKLTEAFEKKNLIEEDIARIEKERTALTEKVSGYEKKLTDISSEYETRIQGINAELEKLKAGTIEELTKKNAEIEGLKREMAEFEKRSNKAPSREAADSSKEEAVKLQPITITTPQGVKKDVKVLEVNKDYSFIVIDIGSSHGIKEGDLLYVFRNKKLLGRVVVERVEDEISVAKMLYKEVADNVRKGDKVGY